MDFKNKNLGFFMTRGVFFSKWQSLGSFEREIKPYIELSKYFKEIFIFSYGTRDSVLFSNYFPKNVLIIDRPVYINSFLYSFLMPLIQNRFFQKLNLIKTNQMDGSWPAVFGKIFYKVPLVVRCGYEWLLTIERLKKNFLKRKFAFWVEKFAYKNADRIILSSDAIKDFVTKRFDVDSSFINVIPNYIDTDLFSPSLSIKKNTKSIAFLGRLEQDKNPNLIIEACKGLDVEINFIGKGSLKNLLENSAKTNNVRASFLGMVEQKNLPQELNKNSIFILPSNIEGSPKALLEAMSCGLACVGSDVEGINNVITDNENGLLCRLDPVSIREKIIQLIENKELCDRLGSSARDFVCKNNGFGNFITKELSVYNDLNNEKNI